MTASVLDHRNREITLNDCACGAEPEYRSRNGIAHAIACPKCGLETDLEMTGMDAVCEWNAGHIYPAGEAPIRTTLRQRSAQRTG